MKFCAILLVFLFHQLPLKLTGELFLAEKLDPAVYISPDDPCCVLKPDEVTKFCAPWRSFGPASPSAGRPNKFRGLRSKLDSNV